MDHFRRERTRKKVKRITEIADQGYDLPQRSTHGRVCNPFRERRKKSRFRSICPRIHIFSQGVSRKIALKLKHNGAMKKSFCMPCAHFPRCRQMEKSHAKNFFFSLCSENFRLFFCILFSPRRKFQYRKIAEA